MAVYLSTINILNLHFNEIKYEASELDRYSELIMPQIPLHHFHYLYLLISFKYTVHNKVYTTSVLLKRPVG